VIIIIGSFFGWFLLEKDDAIIENNHVM